MTISKLEVLQQNLICQAVCSFTTNILFPPVVTTLQHAVFNYIKILSLILGYSVWFWLVNKIKSWFILMGWKKFITSIISGITLTLKPDIWKDRKCLQSYC